MEQLTETEWAEHLNRWRQSGKSARAYCAEHGLKFGTLRYWSGRLRRSGKGAGGPTGVGFAPIRRKDTSHPKVSSRAGSGLRLKVSKTVVEVDQELDAETVLRVLQAIGSQGGER